jgi:hypothetical protein
MSLTVSACEKALRAELVSGRVTLERRPLFRNYATVDLSSRPHLIVVDPHYGGIVEGVVHELIHVVFRKRLAEWGQLEEVIVVALECAVMQHINRSRERATWWRRKIAAELGDA